MVISTIGPTAREKETLVAIIFTRGVCWDGVNYGPAHKDEPVQVPLHEAANFIRQGRAELLDEADFRRMNRQRLL